jgi:hypothetical protein
MAGHEVVPPRFRRDGIRPAVEEDAEQLVHQHWKPANRDVREWQGRIRRGGVFVAEEEGEICGSIWVEAEGEVGHVREFEFDRARGIPPLLIKAAKRYLAEAGCKALELSWSLYNPDSDYASPDPGYWTRLGFVQVEEDPPLEEGQEPDYHTERLFRCELEPRNPPRRRPVRPPRMFPRD